MTEKELERKMDELYRRWEDECRAHGAWSPAAVELRKDYLNTQARYREVISAGKGQ